MSLISEALRKARQEAAEREAKERGMEAPVVAGYWKRGGRLGVGLVLGAAIAMGAAVIGGGLVWWALEDRADPKVVEETSGGEAPAGAEVVEVQPAQDNAALVIDEAAEEVELTSGSVDSTSDEPEVLADIADTALAGVEVVESEPDNEEGVSVEVSSPQPQIALAAGEFVGEAHVGDVTLTLDYLVFRKENPFAQINGRDVRVGAVIEDYVVESITEDRVVLTQGDNEIVLRVQ